MSISGFELSPSQARAWTWQRQDLAARVQCALDISGVDPARLRGRLATLGEEHELLRTRFVRATGMAQPAQVIADTAALRLHEESITAAALELHLSQWLQSDIALDQPGQLALRLLNVDDGRQVLQLGAPALLCDGAGLLRLAAALLADGESAEEPIQYVDIAAGLNEQLQGGAAKDGRHYWTNICAELPATPLLAGERAAMQAPLSAGFASLLPADVAIALSSAGERAESLLLACWATLLSRACRQGEIAVAVASDGRADEELAGVFGPLTRYLPMRAAADAQQPLNVLAAGLARQLEQAREWQEYYTGETLAGTEGEAGYLPFAFALTRVDLPVALLRHSACEERSHLCLRVLAQDNKWTLELVYDAARFDAARAQLLLDQYQQLLTAALASPQSRLAELDHVSRAERELLLAAADSDDNVDALGLHQLFAATAAAHPQRLALTSAKGDWTYAQLEREANRLAHYLIAHGVRPQTRVAVCLDREPRLIVALLGLLKAGGVYVPVDPEFHPQRIRYLLNDAGCGLLLSDRAHAGVLGEDAQPVLLDNLDSLLAGYPDSAPEIFFAARQLAYLIYTSGSTGQPKGVGVSHAAAHNYLRGVLTRLNLSAEAELLSLATIGADLGHTALLGALCGGRTLRLIGADAVLDAEGLATQLAARPVDCLKIVPTHLRALLNVDNAARLLPRECLVLGGSALEPGLVAQIQSLAPGLRIVNHYGPTETTVGVTTQTVDQIFDSTVPIGRALRNSRAYVLDAQGELAGEGIAGELHIGGAALAQGYWNQPGMTAEKFIPDAFGAQPGGRLYRTGDLAYVAEGRVHFLGRVDHQVKIRGYRVELGEVEAVLCRHADVDDAVVVLRDERLAAYVVSSAKPDVNALREWLRNELPDYMVPSAWLVLKNLPLNRNGKVERSALPAIGASNAGTRAYLAPRTALESELVELWQSILGVEQVGVHDDFFERGGYSLLVTQLLAWTKKQLGAALPLRRFFEQPTVAAMAEFIAAQRGGSADSAPPLQALPRSAALRSSPGQQRLWITQHMGEASSDYNTAHVWELRGELDTAALAQAFSRIVERHEALRTTYRFEDGVVYQQIGAAAPVTLHRETLPASDAPIAGIPVLVEKLRAEAAGVFDLAQAAPLRLRLFQLGARRHVLSFVVHHIASDGWSAGLLQREWSALYNAARRGETLALAPLALQYADFAAWQRSLLDGGHWQAQKDWWRARLAGLAPAELAADTPLPRAAGTQAASHAFRIDAALSEALRARARAANLTPFMLLAAALKIVLARHTGRDDIAIGTSVAGRNRAETTELIGFFVNQLVLRTDLGGDPTVDEFLARTRDTVLGALDHQDIPFSTLVAEMPPQRGSSRTPFFQLLVVLQDFPDEALQLDGLAAQRWLDDQPAAKFDISLYLGSDADGMAATWVYDANLFSSGLVQRLSQHLLTVLGELLARPGERLSALAMLSAAEQQALAQEKADRKASKFKKLREIAGA